MPLNFNQPEQMSPREYQDHEWEVEMFDKQAAHAIQIKELDIKAAKLEAKMSSWFKLPVTIIKLPVLILFGFAFICAQFTKRDLPAEFWAFLR